MQGRIEVLTKSDATLVPPQAPLERQILHGRVESEVKGSHSQTNIIVRCVSAEALAEMMRRCKLVRSTGLREEESEDNEGEHAGKRLKAVLV